MAAVTWKNIAPTSGSGILDALNESGGMIGTGIGGIGDAITGYADDRTARETDAFVASLLQAGDDDAARAALMTNQNMGFIDQNRINTFEQARQDKILAEANKRSFLDLETAAQIKINAAKPDKNISVKYGNDPLVNHFEKQIGEDEGFWSFLGLGSGFDQDDKEEFNQYKARFLSEYGDKNKYGDKAISGKQFNQFVTDGNIIFEDNPLNDEFVFNHKDKKYNLSDFGTSGSQLFDFISASKGKESQSNIDDKLAFAKFSLANPDISANDMWPAYIKQRDANKSK
jgi:hypothetical protein